LDNIQYQNKQKSEEKNWGKNIEFNGLAKVPVREGVKGPCHSTARAIQTCHKVKKAKARPLPRPKPCGNEYRNKNSGL